MPFLTYILKRLVGVFFVVLSVTLILFILIRSVPGDPARVLAGFDAPPDVVEEIRRRYGLDRSLPEQLVMYMINLMKLDLGKSIRTDAPVVYEVMARLPNTVVLAVVSMAIALAVGIPLGTLAAIKRETWVDYVITSLTVLGTSIPTFWLGLMLILLFAVQLRLLPAGGSGTPAHIILPAVTLALPMSAPIVRATRSSVLEVLNQDFVRAARSKGLGEGKVLFKHVLRNALIPVTTIAGLQLGNLMSGAVITETVFAWPGVGRLVVDSIFARDYPMVQGAIFIFAIIYALINLVVDILYVVIDPRIRIEEGG